METFLYWYTIVSDPMKIAWVLWIGWGIAQIGWYRRTRHTGSARHYPPPPSRDSTAGVRRSAAVRGPLPASSGDKPPWEQS
jgi:hypothetical protein